MPYFESSEPPAFSRSRHAHLIGVCGAGMSALAEVLHGRGWRLSGSDLALGSGEAVLPTGTRLFDHHAAGHVTRDVELVVYSSAIPPENPERRRALEWSIPQFSYFEMLGQWMRGRQGLAVAGTHGKSTTTAMAAQILVEGGRNPTVIYGATAMGGASAARAGDGDCVLVEACEYRSNFLHLEPKHLVLLGVEPDHFDCFPTPATLEAAFAAMVARVPSDGLLLVHQGCPVARWLAGAAACRVKTFGLCEGGDWSVSAAISCHGRYEFQIRHAGGDFARVALAVPGRHNVLNALAAAALCAANGVPAHSIAASLGHFRGLRRRLESLGTWGGVAVVDDYAHHPTEIRASLAALRQMYPQRRVWCVFQPHQASRTERLMDELASSLQNADRVLVAEIFRAREPAPRPGEVVAADLAREVRARGSEVPSLHTVDEIVEYLQTHLAPGDVLVTMGAGDIGRIGHGFMDRFRKDRAAG